MPAFNSEKYIDSSILSVINQTHVDFELIIVDDGSSDNTLEIIRKYTTIDERVFVFSNSYGNGAGNARNFGLDRANGKFISFLDSDDIWSENKLEYQLDYMLKNNVDFSFSNYSMFFNDIESSKPLIFPKLVDKKRILKTCDIGCLTVMIKSCLLEKVRFKDIYKEDYALWVDLIVNYDVVAYNCGENLSFYRKHSNSISSNKYKEIYRQACVLRSVAHRSIISTLINIIFYIYYGLKKHS